MNSFLNFLRKKSTYMILGVLYKKNNYIISSHLFYVENQLLNIYTYTGSALKIPKSVVR